MQEIDFITTDEYTKEDIKKVQQILLKMAKAVANILEVHNIPYMMAYGTLLGAVRHGGFIPWDDDFDFYLFDESYDNAIEVLRKELPADMFLEDEKSEPLYFHGWAHVKDLNSKMTCDLFPQDDIYSHKGISLDLYRMKKMQKKELDNYINQENIKYIERRYSKGLLKEEEYVNRVNQWQENVKRAKENICNDDREIYGFLSIRNCHWLEIDDIFPLKEIGFEDTVFLGPNRDDIVLTKTYGAYMTLPSIEGRKSHYSKGVFEQGV